MSQLKEPGYFVEELHWNRGEAWYLSSFVTRATPRWWGNPPRITPNTRGYRDVPERIARFNPAARFIYIMRDPVERTISHYWHAVRHRLRLERRDLLTAVREEPHYRDVSHYAMQLERYIRIFGQERILAVTFEEMNAQPETFVTSIFRWLGVESSFIPPNLDERSNVTPKSIRRIKGRGLLHEFRHTGLWNAVGRWVPPSVRRVRQAPRSGASGPVPQQATAEAIAYLRPIQAEQTRKLAELLDGSFLNGRRFTGGHLTSIHVRCRRAPPPRSLGEAGELIMRDATILMVGKSAADYGGAINSFVEVGLALLALGRTRSTSGCTGPALCLARSSRWWPLAHASISSTKHWTPVRTQDSSINWCGRYNLTSCT